MGRGKAETEEGDNQKGSPGGGRRPEGQRGCTVMTARGRPCPAKRHVKHAASSVCGVARKASPHVEQYRS